ncbi:MAG: hypothetical protein J5950_02305 [Clostridia bacterium]|nr:hypothetical protein [Clostridia bacterium]
MFGFFRKKKDKDTENESVDGKGKGRVIVLKKTKPGMCGGTDATQDTRAPKEILSREMTLFDVTSALGSLPRDSELTLDEEIGFVSAFAAQAGDNTFLFLEKGDGFRRYAEKTSSWALVRGNVFPELVTLVNDCRIAANNGFHSTTHGLPENFGGSIDIRYASGERISISDNQSPLIGPVTGYKIAKLFERLLGGEKAVLPDVSLLSEIRFEEERKAGSFTHATLKFLPDGTGVNHKKSCYDSANVYESEKTVDAETVGKIKKNIADNGLLAWAELPSNGYNSGEKKKLTFVFESGEEIIVSGDKKTPDQLRSAFFAIELEMTTKH